MENTLAEWKGQVEADVNQLRKQNKNNWYQYVKSFEYQGKTIDIRIKGFNTWLQVLDINGINHASSCDISVKEFNYNLEQAINYHS